VVDFEQYELELSASTSLSLLSICVITREGCLCTLSLAGQWSGPCPCKVERKLCLRPLPMAFRLSEKVFRLFVFLRFGHAILRWPSRNSHHLLGQIDDCSSSIVVFLAGAGDLSKPRETLVLEGLARWS